MITADSDSLKTLMVPGGRAIPGQATKDEGDGGFGDPYGSGKGRPAFRRCLPPHPIPPHGLVGHAPFLNFLRYIVVLSVLAVSILLLIHLSATGDADSLLESSLGATWISEYQSATGSWHIFEGFQ